MAFLQRITQNRNTQTLSSNAFTASLSFHFVDNQNGDPNDQCDTISGGVMGQLLVLQSLSSARDTWFFDGTGNIKMNVSSNFQLNNVADTVMFIYNANNSLWCEIARSDNTAG